MSGGVPRAVTVAVVMALVVAVGALAGAAAIRWRATQPVAAPSTSPKPAPATSVGLSGCRVDPCTAPVTAMIGETRVELIVDAGSQSARLRIGSQNASQVIELTIVDMGVQLTAQSLQCVSGGPNACMVKGEHSGGIAGEVIVGRSDAWSAAQKQFLSDAGYLALTNADADSAPEVIAAQHDCGNMETNCASQPIFIQVFALTGTLAGCTRNFTNLDSLPGYPPTVDITKVPVTSCKK